MLLLLVSLKKLKSGTLLDAKLCVVPATSVTLKTQPYHTPEVEVCERERHFVLLVVMGNNIVREFVAIGLYS